MSPDVRETKRRANQAKLDEAIANIHPATLQPPHKDLRSYICHLLEQSNTGRCRNWSQANIRTNFDDWLSTAEPNEKPGLAFFLAAKAAHDSLNHRRNDNFDQAVAKRGLLEWAVEQIHIKEASKEVNASGEDFLAEKSPTMEESDSNIKIESVEAAASFAPKAPSPPKSRPSQTPAAPSQPFTTQVFSLKPETPTPVTKQREQQRIPPVPPRKRSSSSLATALTPLPSPKKVKTESIGCQTHVAYVEVSTQTDPEALPQPPSLTTTSSASSGRAASPVTHTLPSTNQQTQTQNQGPPAPSEHHVSAAQNQSPHLQAQIEACVSAAIARQTEALQQAIPSTVRGYYQTSLRDAVLDEMMIMTRQMDPQRGRMGRSMDFGGGRMPTPSSRALARFPPAQFDIDGRSGRSGSWSGIWEPAEFDVGMDRWDYGRGSYYRRD